MNRTFYKKVVLVVGVLSLLLCGCQKTDVDYELDTQSVQKTQGNSNQEASPLELESVNDWEEDIQATENVEFHINASITIPDVEQMSVTELQQITFDEEYKKEVIQALYGTLEVYSDEEADWPKSRWQTKIEDTERSLQCGLESIAYYEKLLNAENEEEISQDKASIQADIEGCEERIRELEEEIADYTEKMEAAPNAAEAVSDFSGNRYFGTYNSMIYTLLFDEEDNVVCFSVADSSLVIPDEYKDSGVIFWTIDSELEQTLENQCIITEEEGKKQAEAVLPLIGWTDPEWEYIQKNLWSFYKSENKNEQTVADGYLLSAQKGDGTLGFGEFDTGYEMIGGEYKGDFDGKAQIRVNDHGIIDITVFEPVEFVQKTENVSLLSLDTIKGIIKKELSNNPDKYMSDDEKTNFTKLELNYARVKDKSREGYFSYVPVWRLCHMTRMNNEMGIASCPVFVNAIDGSIMELEDMIDIVETAE